jgi:DNA-binding NtrC family response regulator
VTQTNEPSGKILVVDDERHARATLATLLEDCGYEVRGAGDGNEALATIERWLPDVVLTDLRMPRLGGMELLTSLHERYPELPCVVMTAFASVDTAVEAMKRGAQDYLLKPLNFDAVEIVVARALERAAIKRELLELRRARVQQASREMIGSSQAMRRLLDMVDTVADSRATVLVLGESGTGKELVARRLHQVSPRADAPFVSLHCGAIPEGLLESELFGHEKGAFTGASARRKGRFERAHGGTLFLDEIGDISTATQLKLLRVLQERRFERVGGSESIEVDVRVVCATHRDLLSMVREGTFREDLYYRLAVIELRTPPLRERPEDVAPIARHLVAKLARKNEREIEALSPESMTLLERYAWPGNVRELENALERAVVLARDGVIEPRHLPEHVTGARADLPREIPTFESPGDAVSSRPRVPGATLSEIERDAILRTFHACDENTARTADMLGISQRKIQYRLREYREEAEARDAG